jgi:FKBP-type peptidyl-prolyl cis-trans isomerase FkpA
MIKKLLPACVALIVIITYSSCRVIDNGCGFELDPSIKAPDSEIVRLDNYITSQNITGLTKDPSGFYYKIVNAGTGSVAGQCNVIGFTYAVALTNGNIVEKSDQTKFYPLKDLIFGWRIAIPYIKTGGSLKLYLPPSFAYGQENKYDNITGQVTIPKNSILIFDVSLNEVR